MNSKIKLIQKYLKKNNFKFYLFTNSDMHLNESPNLNQKDIFILTGFDCSHGYLLIMTDKIVFFTDSRYSLAANKFFSKQTLVYDINKLRISEYLKSIGSNYKGLIDPNLFSLKDFKLLSKDISTNNIKIIPFYKKIIAKNYYPKFDKSYPFSLPLKYIPRPFTKNIEWIKKNLTSQGFIIWNNAHVAYLLNIRSFELHNSTKPFAGLFISNQTKKPVLISNNKNLKNLKKIQNSFYLFSKNKFINFIKRKKINLIELDFKYSNVDIYLSLLKISKIRNSSINIDKFISKKTKTEFQNISFCHKEDGFALTRFIIKIKNNLSEYKDEYSFINDLYNTRKDGINFFRNSFDYISALDKNGAIVHYKPTLKKSDKLINQSILLLDSGAHYLEGTTDVTRVFKLKKIIKIDIKNYYTYLLKSLIKIENSTFNKRTTGSDLDIFIRRYLLKYNISYGHGTGHGVGYFNDVHEKYPIISSNFNQRLLNNNLFSVEPGYYSNNEFGLRLENLYFSKIKDDKLKLSNITLVPYDLDLINWKLLSIKEKKFLKTYHKKIFNLFKDKFNDFEKKYFIKELINKI